jgi:Zn finger protein HypA/HybF involved in hydrogenase expression
MDILNRINMVIDEASIDQLKSDIQKEFNKGNSKSLVWNRIKRMYRNINKKEFDKICKSLNESQSTKMICRECGHKFKKKIGPKTVEIKCPKCGGYDTDINESTVTADVATNKAQGHIDVIGMRYKKKKKRSKLTGAPIVVYEDEEE